MSKFIKKLHNHQVDEELYDEFDDIDSITMEEIDKEIEDFYIDREKINNIKFSFDKESIIKEAIDKAEVDIKKSKLRKQISKVAAIVVVILSIGVYSPALAHSIPPVMKVLEKINNTLKIDEIASFTGVDKIIPRAVIDKEDKVKFVKPTKYKVEPDDREAEELIEAEINNAYIGEISTEYGAVDFIHRMSNQIIKAVDGRKNGVIDINPQNIEIALSSLGCINDDEARIYLYNELIKWKNGDFENGVLVHNYVWHMLDGNIGRALSLDTSEVNNIKSKYFK